MPGVRREGFTAETGLTGMILNRQVAKNAKKKETHELLRLRVCYETSETAHTIWLGTAMIQQEQTERTEPAFSVTSVSSLF